MSCEHIRGRWKHTLPDGPVEMLYEALPGRSVPRMVETFADGRAEADTLQWRGQRYSMFQGISRIDGDMPTAAELCATTAEECPGELEILESSQIELETAFRNATPRGMDE